MILFLGDNHANFEYIAPVIRRLLTSGEAVDGVVFLGDSLEQLETSFQLRVRRQGVKYAFLTFDTELAAVQALRRIEADLSVGIVRDYTIAAQTPLRDLMVRYRDEVCPAHKGAAIEVNRINRLLRDEKLATKLAK